MKKLYFIIVLLVAVNAVADSVPVVPAKVVEIQTADITVYRIHLETGKIQYIREIVMLNGDICRVVVVDPNFANDQYICGPNNDQHFIKH